MMDAGHINAALKVMPESGSDEEAVITRVVCPNSQIRPTQDTLAIVMRIADLGGLGANVLATFNNGIVYTFTVGKMTHPETIPHDKHILT